MGGGLPRRAARVTPDHRTGVAARAAAAFVLLVIGAACVGGSGSERSGGGAGGLPGGDDRSPGRFAAAACGLPRRHLARLEAGFHPARSGELQMLLQAPNSFLFAHAEPWDHLQRVPMLFYGPGHVPATSVDRRVTMPDVAPTLAEYLGFEFEAPDGKPVREAVLPEAERDASPRLIFVVVMDSAGRNVLDEYPDAWPNLRRLRSGGAWFERATVGSAPAVTPPVHTTLGTGVYPRRHGLVDIYIRADGEVVPSHEEPRYLLTPTLAEVYDRAMGNEPMVGMVASYDWHLGMIGRGSFQDGADRDLAVLTDKESLDWELPDKDSRFFDFPAYVNDVPGLEKALREIDVEDGKADRTWLGEDLTDPTSARRTPALVRWQTAVLQEIIRRDAFGRDDVPDLLFTNFKQVDEVGHRWSLNSRQMEEVVRSVDEAVGELVLTLDREVGRGRWVMVVTADHGTVPSFERTGGMNVDRNELVSDIDTAFGDGVVEQFRPTELWVDVDRLRRAGHTVEDVADFVSDYTKGDNVQDPEQLEEGEREDRLFRAAYPSSVLRNLSCPQPG